MQPMYYIGLDVHKRKISYCVKDSSGKIHTEESIPPRHVHSIHGSPLVCVRDHRKTPILPICIRVC